MRIGEYRALFKVYDDEKIIVVINIDVRGKVYKSLRDFPLCQSAIFFYLVLSLHPQSPALGSIEWCSRAFVRKSFCILPGPERGSGRVGIIPWHQVRSSEGVADFVISGIGEGVGVSGRVV